MKRFTEIRVATVLCAFVVLVVASTACSGADTTPPPAGASDAAGANDTYAPRSDEGVDVVYFETSEPCDCMAEVGDAVEQAVRSSFASEMDSGTVRLFIVVSDEPANAPLVEAYNAQPFDLVLVSWADGQETVTPVYEIWNLMGDSRAIEDLVVAEVKDALPGKP